MTSIKNHKTMAALATIAAFASILIVSASAIESGHNALAQVSNTGVNVPTGTDQKSNCETAGGGTTGSPISGSCDETSVNTINQNGGVLTHNK